jgi:signal transduction histidine kinase
VGLRSRREDDAWVLEIWDTGRGMDPLAIDRLLLPFTQTDITDAGTGWGLGLNIVKRLVEAHDGVLDVESAPGRGTTFRIALRIQKG